MLLSEHGISVMEWELEDQLQLRSDGVSLRSIVETADRYGVRLEAWRFRRDALDSLKSPAILWIDGDHFVVLDSVTSEGAFVRDPAKGRLKVSRQGLLARWDGTAAVGVRTP
jgi:ATP-binding cassette subfamily B protein RaxB